jgi:hypothetical protein
VACAREKSGDEKISSITNLDAAVAASKEPGTYLELFDSATVMMDDVSSLKGFTKNVATAFETAAAKAVSIDPTLAGKYGVGKLLGVGVVFASTDAAFVEIDGLVLCPGVPPNPRVLLVVEAKTHLHMDDINKLFAMQKKLLFVMSNPDLFSGDPDEVLGQVAGQDLTVVCVAVAGSCDAAVAKQCLARGVHLLEPVGSGFSCRLGDVAGTTSAALAVEPSGVSAGGF